MRDTTPEIYDEENNTDTHFEVAISHNNALGYIEYDKDTRKISINIADNDAIKKVTDFLQKDLEIGLPQKTLTDFQNTIIKPLADIKSLQIALTRLWEATGVHVDWSRPVSYVKTHPSYWEKKYIFHERTSCRKHSTSLDHIIYEEE